MTERFNLVKCTDDRWGIEDNILESEDNPFFICREGQFETQMMVTLLNTLYDENEQLKHSIKCLEADKMELQQYIKRMQGDVE